VLSWLFGIFGDIYFTLLMIGRLHTFFSH